MKNERGKGIWYSIKRLLSFYSLVMGKLWFTDDDDGENKRNEKYNGMK